MDRKYKVDQYAGQRPSMEQIPFHFDPYGFPRHTPAQQLEGEGEYLHEHGPIQKATIEEDMQLVERERHQLKQCLHALRIEQN